jgi:hypothetical protein
MSTHDAPRYTAWADEDYLAADDSLAALLAGLAGERDDAVVWRDDHRLAAVLVKGRVQVFEGEGPESNGAPPAPPLPAGPKGGRPQLPYGCKPAALARLFGSWGFSPERAKAALARLGVDLTAEALAQELDAGRAGRGRLPRLGPAQVRALRRALEQADGGEEGTRR